MGVVNLNNLKRPLSLAYPIIGRVKEDKKGARRRSFFSNRGSTLRRVSL